MADPVLKPAYVPLDVKMPTNPQRLVNFIASYLRLDGLAGIQGILIQDTEPTVSSRDRAWLKIDQSSGRAIGIYRYNGGWKALPCVPLQGENEPANPRPCELFYNTKTKTLKAFIDGAWTTELWHKGATADRPKEPAVGYLFFDTDISRLLRYTAQGWSTVDGCIGEIRMFDGMSTTEAQDRNPGWSIYVTMGGRFPIGQSEQYAVGVDGGRESFSWSATGYAAAGGSREQGLINSLSIDGQTATATQGAGQTVSKQGDVKILPPFHSVIFMKKDF